MRHLIRFLGVALAASALVACVEPTSFRGSAKVPNGATGCRAMCSAQGMELAGMVMMGEYSDGCICTLPGQDSTTISTASAQAAAAGVRMQMDAEEEEARRRNQRNQQNQRNRRNQQRTLHPVGPRI